MIVGINVHKSLKPRLNFKHHFSVHNYHLSLCAGREFTLVIVFWKNRYQNLGIKDLEFLMYNYSTAFYRTWDFR